MHAHSFRYVLVRFWAVTYENKTTLTKVDTVSFFLAVKALPITVCTYRRPNWHMDAIFRCGQFLPCRCWKSLKQGKLVTLNASHPLLLLKPVFSFPRKFQRILVSKRYSILQISTPPPTADQVGLITSNCCRLIIYAVSLQGVHMSTSWGWNFV